MQIYKPTQSTQGMTLGHAGGHKWGGHAATPGTACSGVGEHQHPPVFDSEDQLVEAVHVLEAGLVCHRVDYKEAISSPHVLLPHRTELLLACSIQN